MLLIIVFLWCLAAVQALRPRPAVLKRLNPTYSSLSDDELGPLLRETDMQATLNFTNPDSLLSRILIPRPVGSDNLRHSQDLFRKGFKDLGWTVEDDAFEDTTPHGVKPFTNLIFTHNPNATRRLIIAAHLDSKIFPDADFVGATDSAAPCAILYDVAKALTPLLNARQARLGTPEETLQVVLFDGEEAFEQWTDTDSVYGARHLAQKWAEPTHGPSSAYRASPIGSISHLILFDLLGAPIEAPSIQSFFRTTGWLFDEFKHAHERLLSRGSVPGAIMSENKLTYFIEREKASRTMHVSDDHLPFVHRRVPVVHIIPIPFPKVWHSKGDNASALDYDTIKTWSLVTRLTLAEYLGLSENLTETPKIDHEQTQL